MPEFIPLHVVTFHVALRLLPKFAALFVLTVPTINKKFYYTTEVSAYYGKASECK
jgi:hypothetical protein